MSYSCFVLSRYRVLCDFIVSIFASLPLEPQLLGKREVKIHLEKRTHPPLIFAEMADRDR